MLATLTTSVASIHAKHPALRQLIRYVLVGLATNAVGYIAYLSLTYIGIGPKTTVSLLYVLVAGLGFFSNRTLTFASSARALPSAARYLFAHCLGYAINLSMIWLFVDQMGWLHQLVQLAAVLVVASFLFIMLKFFVFRPTS